MPTTQVVFGHAEPTHAIVYGAGVLAQTLTPSGTSQATSIVTTGETVARVATDTAVYVSFGAAPNASTDTARFLVPAHTTELFRVGGGVKAAVVTA